MPAKIVLAVAGLLLSLSAAAGSLSFRLSLTGAQLTVSNQGDSSAFYPAVFTMRSDGSWQRLRAAGPLAEMAAGARLQFAWPERTSAVPQDALEGIQPVLVRFFDQAGVGFGQISFFRSPPLAKTTLTAAYVDGALQISAPADTAGIRASWVLWPQEEGIGRIRLPVRFEHAQPPAARRIDWLRQGKHPFRLDTGAGRPGAILIHETGQGHALQSVPGGGLQGREQRAAWLDATGKFYAAALILLAFGVAAILAQFVPWRRRPAAG